MIAIGTAQAIAVASVNGRRIRRSANTAAGGRRSERCRADGSGGMCAFSSRLASVRSRSASNQIARPVEHEQRDQGEQVEQAERQRDRQVQRGASGAGEPRPQSRRQLGPGGRRDGGHDAAFTVTSPLPLSAWIVHGASSALSMPVTLTRPPVESASTRYVLAGRRR